MPIVHHPFVIPLPFWPHEVTGFGLAVLLAFVIGQIVSQQELLRRGYQKEADAIPDLILASVIGTLIGGKLYYAGIVMQDWSALWGRAGFVFWGGFIGSVVACWIVIRRRKLDFARFSDVAGVAIAAGYSVGRTGCWAVGDDYGTPWSGPLAVMFPEGAPASTAANMNRIFGTPIPEGVSPDTVLAVHPTQLYHTALGFVMFLVLWRFRGSQARRRVAFRDVPCAGRRRALHRRVLPGQGRPLRLRPHAGAVHRPGAGDRRRCRYADAEPVGATGGARRGLTPV